MMNNFLYIDPGTGSMLFSLAIGIATAAVFGIRALSVKLMFIFSGGKINKLQNEKIPYLIFSDHKRYWNVFKPICDEFEKRKINLVYYTMSEDDPALSENYEFVKAEFIGEGNKGIARMNNVNAGTVIATTPQLDVIQWKRSKNVEKYVHVPHSCGNLCDYRMFGLDFYDSFFACGQNQVDFAKKIEDVRNIKKRELRVVGSTFLDAAVAEIETFEKHETDKENPIILLAPSWGKSSILVRFGEKLISQLVDAGFKIVIRPHPQSYTADKEVLDNLMKKFPESEKIEWNRENSNLKVMNRCDMMITDFSGIMIEWALLFNRPFMYTETNFDASVYDAAWFDEENWTITAAKKMGITVREEDFPNIREIILDAIKSDNFQKTLEEIKSDCWGNIGNSAKTIVDMVV